MPEPLEIAAAVIGDERGRVLVARRPSGSHLAGLFEFPGGKVRPGEPLADACRRECEEELGVEVEIGPPVLPRAVHDYGDRAVALTFFRCALAPGSPAPRALAAGEVRWVAREELAGLAWPAANAAIIAHLSRPFSP